MHFLRDRVPSISFLLILLTALSGCTPSNEGSTSNVGPTNGLQGLAQRLLGDKSTEIVFRSVPSNTTIESYRSGSSDGSILIEGTTEIASAVALRRYLESNTDAFISLDFQSVTVPSDLPLTENISGQTLFARRIAPNLEAYATQSTWWSKEKWTEYIDWMALYGVNRPLLGAGIEAVWSAALVDAGVNSNKVAQGISGPSYLPYQWQGRLGRLGGPIRPHWQSQREEILVNSVGQARALGMQPIVPGFLAALDTTLTDALGVVNSRSFIPPKPFLPARYILPEDPVFSRVQKSYYERLKSLLGDRLHFWLDLRSAESVFRNETGSFSELQSAYLESVRRYFPQAEIYVLTEDSSTPGERELTLYLPGDSAGQKIARIPDSYGGTTSLGGNFSRLDEIKSDGLTDAGIWFDSSGHTYNQVFTDNLLDALWSNGDPSVASNLGRYAMRRYASQRDEIAEAVTLIDSSLFRQSGPQPSILLSTPSVEGILALRNSDWLDPRKILQLERSISLLLEIEHELGSNPAYIFDMIHLSRELMDRMGGLYAFQLIDAYVRKDRPTFEARSHQIRGTIGTLDQLMSLDKRFLIGSWLEESRLRVGDPAEIEQYKWNAKSLLTLWNPTFESGQGDYYYRHWQGMLSSYYLARWEELIDQLRTELSRNEPHDAELLSFRMKEFQNSWPQTEFNYQASPLLTSPLAFVKIQVEANRTLLRRLASAQ